jgi:hypothetical protein
MLKAILTPIKTIRGRVRFFENLIRSRYVQYVFGVWFVHVGFSDSIGCVGVFGSAIVNQRRRSFYPESAVEAEEKPSPPIKDDSKCKRLQGPLIMFYFHLFLTVLCCSKWDDWLASSFGIEPEDEFVQEAAAVIAAHYLTCIIQHLTSSFPDCSTPNAPVR